MSSSQLFTSFTDYLKSKDPRKIQASKLRFPHHPSSMTHLIDILSTQYNRDTQWTENQAYRFYDDLSRLYQLTNGTMFDTPELVRYFLKLFPETEHDQTTDYQKFGVRLILNFPNQIHYHCMRVLFFIDPNYLDDSLIQFIHKLYIWLEENAITGSRLHIYYDDRHSGIKNYQFRKVIDHFRKEQGIPDSQRVEIDRLSNTHVVMLWKIRNDKVSHK